MKSMEEIIAATVEKAVTAAIKPLQAEVAELRKELAKAQKKPPEGGERLITQAEARRRLGVNQARLRELTGKGFISLATTPGGRTKVVEGTLNTYIASLQGATA